MLSKRTALFFGPKLLQPQAPVPPPSVAPLYLYSIDMLHKKSIIDTIQSTRTDNVKALASTAWKSHFGVNTHISQVIFIDCPSTIIYFLVI